MPDSWKFYCRCGATTTCPCLNSCINDDEFKRVTGWFIVFNLYEGRIRICPDCHAKLAVHVAGLKAILGTPHIALSAIVRTMEAV